MSKLQDSVLLVDDDIDLCELLGEFLCGVGFDVTCLHSGTEVIDRVRGEQPPDVVVLDIMMPGMSGLEVLQVVRQHSALPVIMLTGRGDDIDRIIGLELGADDYLGKPCNPRELSARLKAVLRRTKYVDTVPSRDCFQLHDIKLNAGKLEVSFKGHPLTLTSAEFNLLHLLMASAGSILKKDYLTEQVLRRKLTAYDRSIDVHVSRIRQKLIALGGEGDIIKSIRGAGYQMLLDGESRD